MSINLGNDGIRAASALRPNTDFAALRAAIGDTADKLVDNAISIDPSHRVDATAYARGVRDMWVAIEAATVGVLPKTVPKRSTTGKGEGVNHV